MHVASSTKMDSGTKLAITTALMRLKSSLKLLLPVSRYEARPYDYIGDAQKCGVALDLLLRATDTPLDDFLLSQFGWTDIPTLQEQILFCAALAFDPETDDEGNEADPAVDACKLFRIKPSEAKKGIANWRHAVEQQMKLDQGQIEPIEITPAVLAMSEPYTDGLSSDERC